MIKYILFDLDGTLTDPYEGISKCIIYALDNMGFEKHENYRKFIGPPLTYSFENFCKMTREQSLEAVKIYRQRFSTVGLFENKVYDGIPDLLSSLRQQNAVLAVATSKPTCFSTRILEKFGLDKYFDIVIGSEFNGERIEKEKVIAECLKRLAVPLTKLDEVVMIGDRKFDILGAKQNDIKSIGVEYGYAQDDELLQSGADHIVKSVEELKDLLTELMKR